MFNNQPESTLFSAQPTYLYYSPRSIQIQTNPFSSPRYPFYLALGPITLKIASSFPATRPHIFPSKLPTKAKMADTPRITSQYLDSFTGKTIRIVGKVTQLRGTTATIDSEGAVTLVLNHVSALLLC